MPSRQTPVEKRAAKNRQTETHLWGAGVAPRDIRAPSGSTRRVIVVGAPEDIPRALGHPAVLEGRFDARAALAIPVDTADTEPDVGQLAAMLAEHEVNTILVAGPIGASAMRRLADIALVHHCEVLAVMPTEVIAGHEPVVVWTGDSHLVRVAAKPDRRLQHAFKRFVDVAGAALGLAVLAPLLALLAAAIRLDSRGPVFYLQERLGRRGARFRCVKLRTMRHDAEDMLRSDRALYAAYRLNHFKIPDNADSRITRVGRLLRRASIDELPQLWNVLRGEMSLVGPRPVVEEEIGVYGTGSDLLLSVRPGITGNWAVNGRHSVGYPERCDLELQYVREWTLSRDVGILLRTAAAVVSPGG